MSKKRIDKLYKKVSTYVGLEYWIKKEIKANGINLSQLVNKLLKEYISTKKGD